MASTTQRITGMYTGMDTDSLVKAMVANQQSKIDRLDRKKQLAEWKKEEYNNFNTKLKAFRENYGSSLGSESLVKKSAYIKFNVEMSVPGSLKVDATADAKGGSYNVRVDRLATATSMTGTKASTNASGLSDSVIKNTAIEDIESFSSGDFTTLDNTIRFTINDVDFEFETSDTLKTVMDAVNASSAGVTMSYSQVSDKFTIVSNQTGAYVRGLEEPDDSPPIDPDDEAQYNKDVAAYNANQKRRIDIGDDDDGFLFHLGLETVEAGQDALVYLNGESEARTLSENSLTIEGFTVSFLKTTDKAGVDFSLEPSHSDAVENVKTFVTTLNGLIADLFNAYNSKVDRDFNPLVQSQKDEMQEKEVEQWQAKAREGILSRDNELGRLLSNLRSLTSKSYADEGTLASIGISTSKYSAGSPFSFEVDEEKLTKALSDDPDKVFKIMGQANTKGSEGGFIMQINKHIDNFSGNTKSREIQNLDTNINQYSKDIKEQTVKLETLSEKYYLQYAKMETMLSEMQAQQDSLSSYFTQG